MREAAKRPTRAKCAQNRACPSWRVLPRISKLAQDLSKYETEYFLTIWVEVGDGIEKDEVCYDMNEIGNITDSNAMEQRDAVQLQVAADH
jgi:hypothetical protein